jgi:hypothetical protein
MTLCTSPGGADQQPKIRRLSPHSHDRPSPPPAMSSTRKPIRLALLVCDTLMQSILDAHGAYPEIFDALLRASAPAGVAYELTPYDVVDAMTYPPLDAPLDGMLLTGSSARLRAMADAHVLIAGRGECIREYRVDRQARRLRRTRDP